MRLCGCSLDFGVSIRRFGHVLVERPMHSAESCRQPSPPLTVAGCRPVTAFRAFRVPTRLCTHQWWASEGPRARTSTAPHSSSSAMNHDLPSGLPALQTATASQPQAGGDERPPVRAKPAQPKTRVLGERGSARADKGQLGDGRSNSLLVAPPLTRLLLHFFALFASAVTGGGGFLGSHLVDYLMARGDHVRRLALSCWLRYCLVHLPLPRWL